VFGSTLRFPFLPAESSKARRDAAAGRVDVQIYVLLGVLALEVQELRDDGVRHLVVHGRPEEDDPVVQQPRINVHRPLPARALLYHVRNDQVGVHAHPNTSLTADTLYLNSVALS
jgi:hypothetical protein